MSKTYLVTFTPQEPYFFGNEKTFIYTGQKNSGQFGNKYYIKSEPMPSQSTIFGAIRYLMLPEKKYCDANKNIIGAESFKINSSDKQKFGVIEGMSPIFIRDDKSKSMLVPTPKNHIIKSYDESKNTKTINTEYTPFQNYHTEVTSKGERMYASDFNSKDGIADSFMSIDDGRICDKYSLFATTIRVGINRLEKKEGFFKKEFVIMKRGFSFAVYLKLSDDARIPKLHTSVYLGQNKSLFEVNIIEENNFTEEKLIDRLSNAVPEGKHIVYCLSDTFASTTVYNKSVFAAVTTKTYRSFTTENGRVTKDSVLYNIIAAGSIFILNDTDTEAFINQNANQVGYNSIIVK